MFPTSADCRAIAGEKLAEAGRDERHRKRLTTAAEGWLFLAGQLGHLEKSLGYDVVEKKGRVTRGLVTISSVSGSPSPPPVRLESARHRRSSRSAKFPRVGPGRPA